MIPQIQQVKAAFVPAHDRRAQAQDDGFDRLMQEADERDRRAPHLEQAEAAAQPAPDSSSVPMTSKDQAASGESEVATEADKSTECVAAPDILASTTNVGASAFLADTPAATPQDSSLPTGSPATVATKPAVSGSAVEAAWSLRAGLVAPADTTLSPQPDQQDAEGQGAGTHGHDAKTPSSSVDIRLADVVSDSAIAVQRDSFAEAITTVTDTASVAPNNQGARQIALTAALVSQTAPSPAPPLPMPQEVSAQLLVHTSAAKTGGIELLLTPEELGHVRFQMHQHGESMRVVLSAERPETTEFLRRHAEHLMQEFRDSGFSDATLSFGQWAQQDHPPAAQTLIAAQLDEGFGDIARPVAPRSLAQVSLRQGLDIRL